MRVAKPQHFLEAGGAFQLFLQTLRTSQKLVPKLSESRENWRFVNSEILSRGIDLNLDFWDDLEQRMNRDPAPPLGVTFTREFPVEVLEFVDQLLNNWGGR